MKIKISIAAVLFLILLFTTYNTYSYHFLFQQNSSGFVFEELPSLPVNFRVDGGTLGGEDGLPLVNAACDEWNSLEGIGDFCGNITQIGSDITSENFNSLVSNVDGIHDIIFDEDGTILADLGFPSALGAGITTFNSLTGEIIDIRIVMNGSVCSSTFTDLLSTLVHEMGHAWGLAHTPIGGIRTNISTPGLDPISPSAIPTMFPFNIPTNDQFGRSLEPDDLAAARILYGQ